MDNNDVIARRFTDERYLSKSEIQLEMRTSLVDGYWKAVLAYREDFKKKLPFHGIRKLPFYYVETPAIREKITSFSARLDSFLLKLSNLFPTLDGRSIRQETLFEILDSIDVEGDFQMSELSLKALINGTYDEEQPFHEPLINYHSLLNKLSERPYEGGVEDFLAYAYGELRGEGEELTEFYRLGDLDPSVERIKWLSDAIYPSAPAGEVEGLMGEFVPYLSHNDDLYFVSAVFALYFLTYVKPFAHDYNAMMASLLFKERYASLSRRPSAYLFPFERLLVPGRGKGGLSLLDPGNKKRELLKKEVQRSGDLTYILFDAIDGIGGIIQRLEEKIAAIRLSDMKKEAMLDKEELSSIRESTSSFLEEGQLSLFDSPAEEETKPAPLPPAPHPVPEAPAPVIPERIAPVVPHEVPAAEVEKEEVPPAPAPEPEGKASLTSKEKEEVKPVRLLSPEEFGEGKSLFIEPQRLSEKEAREYVLYLLETNPALSRKQAAFLSTHCTMGRYYTIQQFKTSARVAYETARTSMDKLASLGYYEKLQVKNKFVYTPVMKGKKS